VDGAHGPTGAQVAMVAGDGTLASVRPFALPTSLAAWKGNAPVGATWTGQGVLFDWVEEVDGTLADGKPTVAQTLKLQFVGLNGSVGEVTVPEGGACTMCQMQVLAASVGNGVSLAFGPSPNTVGSPISTARAGYASVSVDGVLLSSGDITWLSSSLAGSLVSLQASGANLLLVAGDEVFRVSPSLARLAGPVQLPSPSGDAVCWQEASGEVAFAWTEGFGPDGSTGVGVDPDLYFEATSAGGGTGVQRISTGGAVYAVAADGTGDYGVVFAADGQDYFSLVGRTGLKVGGDVDLTPYVTGDDAGPSNFLLVPEVHRLSAPAPGQFVDLYVANGMLGRRAVSCAP
jgi:hypothetical protein